MSSNRFFALPLIPSLVVATVAGMASFSMASVAYSTTTVTTGTTFASGAVIANPSSLAVTGLASETNQQQQELIQTFVPSSTFTLSQVSILSGGKAGGTVTLHLYPINTTVTGQGGGNADGFVNTQFSTDLLGAGAGLTATVNGSGSDQIVNFAFDNTTTTDRVTLTAGVEYGFEVDTAASGNFSWERDAGGAFSTGNLYQAASGTTKGQVGGAVDRDGYFAVYATGGTPEPASLAVLGVSGMALIRRRRQA